MKPSIKNSVHLPNEKHPFANSWTNSRPLAKTVGVETNPGGKGNGQSANAAMKTKTKLNGPGKI